MKQRFGGNWFKLALATTILAGAATALADVLPLAYQTATGAKTCPALAGIRACYIVAAGYGFIFMSQIVPRRGSTLLFYCGWVPVFLLAATGTSLELTLGDACPTSPKGWPMCYSSLMLSLLLCAAFLLLNYSNKASDEA